MIPDDWRTKAQEGEYRFHLDNKWRASGDFMRETVSLLRSFGFAQDQFNGKTIIDIGAGSKLRTKFFVGAKIIAIEPLADRFISAIDWCDLPDAHMVISKPAEQFIPELTNIADFVISINALDHCFDFRKIIQNIERYMKPGSLAFLSFDSHEQTNDMHPLILNEQVCDRAFLDSGLLVDWVVTNRETYGHGEMSLSYMLRKP